MKAIGYIRVSTEGQVKDGVSLDNQENRIRRYCEYKGLELVEIIRDEGISGGKNAKRPGFVELLGLIQKKDVEAVVLYSLERLSRDMLTLLALERLLDEFEIKLHTVEGEIDTTNPNGFMNFAMSAFMGEMERRQVKYRTKKAMEYKKANGKVVGKIPYGYRREGNDLVEEPEEMEILEKANSLYADGMNLAEIVREFKSEGIKTRTGKDFTSMQVKRLINNYQDVKKKKTSKLANSIQDFIMNIA